jgi:hypothetical protein
MRNFTQISENKWTLIFKSIEKVNCYTLNKKKKVFILSFKKFSINVKFQDLVYFDYSNLNSFVLFC